MSFKSISQFSNSTEYTPKGLNLKRSQTSSSLETAEESPTSQFPDNLSSTQASDVSSNVNSPCSKMTMKPEIKASSIKKPLKTIICDLYTSSSCPYGATCKNAHGEAELGTPVISYKTKLKICRTFHDQGFCMAGDECEYIHSQLKVQKAKVTAKRYENIKLPYEQTLGENIKVMSFRDQKLEGHMESMQFLNFFRTPRLDVFKDI